MVRCACGSRSIRQTRFPCSARAAPRLTVVVVFPTPPFWFINAMIRTGHLHVDIQIPFKVIGRFSEKTVGITRSAKKPAQKKRKLPPWPGSFLCCFEAQVGAKA